MSFSVNVWIHIHTQTYRTENSILLCRQTQWLWQGAYNSAKPGNLRDLLILENPGITVYFVNIFEGNLIVKRLYLLGIELCA